MVLKKNNTFCTVCGQKLLYWKLMGSKFHLVEIFVTVPKVNNKKEKKTFLGE